MTKGEYLSRVKTASPQPLQVAVETMTVRAFGSTAIVVGIYREKSTIDGKTVFRRWRFIDSRVNKKGSSKLVAAASSPLPKCGPSRYVSPQTIDLNDGAGKELEMRGDR